MSIQTSETGVSRPATLARRAGGSRLFCRLGGGEGDPLADINVVLNKVKWVMKGGAVVADKTKAQPR
jgi:hypothetical protein